MPPPLTHSTRARGHPCSHLTVAYPDRTEIIQVPSTPTRLTACCILKTPWVGAGTPGRYVPMRQKQYEKAIHTIPAPMAAWDRFRAPVGMRRGRSGIQQRHDILREFIESWSRLSWR